MKRLFPYSREEGKFYPTVDVTLKGPKRKRAFKALVDSGASLSIFRSEVADYLGLRLEQGKAIYLTGIGGRILGYLHKINLSVDGTNFFQCKMVFSKELTVSLNILGRDNFFLPFLITLDERNKRTTLQDNK